MYEADKSTKLCFVTIGATAAFDSLIKAVLQPHFIKALAEIGYTKLRLQYGENQALYKSLVADVNSSQEAQVGVEINGFAFNQEGLGAEMRDAKDGVVISHAGSGSILDALRISAPLIVVPNPTLLDNHQAELAEEMAAQGYAVHGHLDNLPAALRDVEKLRKKMQEWPPKSARGDGRGLIGVMDDEMGFVD